MFVDGENGNIGIGTSVFVDTSKIQIEGAKTVSSGIPRGQLNISDSTAVATGVGGSINFSGNYNGTSKTTYGSIEGSKENGTSGEYGGALVFKTRANGGNNNSILTISSAGNITVPQTANNTTSASANMVVTSGGEYAKSTSSKRYKNTINDATHGLTELLKLRSVTFKGNKDGDIVFGGLIAEEVHDAGLTEFVVYNDDDQPDALAYSNMVSLCIKAIQELKTELDNAKARITALES